MRAAVLDALNPGLGIGVDVSQEMIAMHGITRTPVVCAMPRPSIWAISPDVIILSDLLNVCGMSRLH
jgi:hypothetical protein